ncbi:MAG: D-alanine--D-alanine ligase [candidate division WOR-3 bacterium]
MTEKIIRALKRKRIGVLMGGWSSEREISLLSGKNICESLQRQGFNCVGIDINKNFAQQIEKAKIDIAFIALHGKPGEDGTIQGFLELKGIPYTGSGVMASAIGMDKVTTKRLFQVARIPTPDYVPIPHPASRIPHSELRMAITEAERRFGYPMMLKPRYEGSSVGIRLIRSSNPKLLPLIIKRSCQRFGEVFLEQFIEGMIATVGIVGEKVLPILELVPKKQEFYDYKAKYTKGETEFIIPARLSKKVTKQIEDFALTAHRVIGCRGLSRIDLVVNKNRYPYFLEVNTLPGMTELSDLPAEARAIGISYDELVLRILSSALE